ncbi:MFS general substrate transporter [Lentithecium fluviatile CBS 122367]|uniref:MFS general substrate transporter n=1 Tax=Lentithecium fluviatile CBS 122367 TaxID=1168545 RepID=A0A6G1IJ09_9PLEO|nr:MFS general substrate transporter [Lentithecium fluviatile CBS 122367]
MQEEDYEILRGEARAEPKRYSQWDPQGEFRQQYEQMHSHDPSYEERIRSGAIPEAETEDAHPIKEDTAPLSRHSSSSSSTSSSASSTSSGAHTPRLEEIRTQRITSQRSRRGTVSTGVDEGSLYRHPTERHPEALRRIETHRSQHALTVGASQTPSRLSMTLSRRKTQRPLPEMGADKPFPPPLPDREEYVVEYNGVDDPLHAQNWPMKKKIWIGAVLAFNAIAVSMGSSIFSSAIRPVAQEFGVIPEVTTLGTSMFVFGYAFGPLVWAPFSELYGRKQPLILAAFGFSIFSIAVAVGKDLQTILICRFFAGLFGSCPLAVVAAVFADMFNNKLRGQAVAVFSACVFMGPLFAPFIGGFITESDLGWRWTEYISGIMGWVSFGLLILFMEETYPPVVLVSKAAELRRRTKNWGIHAKQEEIEVDFRELLVRNVSRPMRILFTEPIILLVTIYMSFIYGLLYLFLTAYSLVFQGVYGWSAGLSGLVYFGMVAGELIAFAVIFLTNPSYVKKLDANDNVPIPEWRLPIAMIGAPLFAAGLFWFGWTGYSGTVHWIVPVLSGLFTGFGIFSIFLSLLNYIVDSYLMFAASAIAANTFMRSLFGGIFPLFATYMFNGMGIQWASTLLGCVAVVCIPMPVVFYLYGKKIRAKSKFAPAPDLEKDKRRDEEARGESAVSESESVVPSADMASEKERTD